MAIDVTQLKAQFGAYYIANPQNMKRLRAMIYKAAETAKYFQDRPGDDTIYRGTLAQLSRIVQPFQKAFTPIGTLSFKPNEFPLYKLKIDLEEYPDELEATYVGFLAALPENDRSQWPFVRWFMEEHVMPKKDEDLEENEYFKGVFAAPAAGVAGAAGSSMNGIRTVIRGYNTAGRLALGNGPVALGAIPATPADFCTYVESLADAIPSAIRSKLDFIFMSKELETKYRRGKRAKYGKDVQFIGSQELATLEDYQHIKVAGLESHSGSNLIWTSIPANRIRPTKKAALANTMKVETAKRAVSLYTDWWEALNFDVPEFVFTNDQDLA